MDCSGFVCEVLRAYGEIGNKSDYTSQQLLNLKKDKLLSTEIPLAFYGKSEHKITHVAIVYDQLFVIESAGEGRRETEKGFVRIRPLTYRDDLIGVY